MAQLTTLTAALAGIPTGLQAQGLWAGRRQLFVRFAAEAETATMYTADALASEIKRALSRTAFHSIAISGRDPLGNIEYLRAAFDRAGKTVPVMLDGDGQRPAELEQLLGKLSLAQVTLEGVLADATTDRCYDSIRVAAKAGVEHALVLCADGRTTDAQVLRVVERAHAASDATRIVIHPSDGAPVDRDRRWTTLFERACALHRDTKLALRLPPPTGMR